MLPLLQRRWLAHVLGALLCACTDDSVASVRSGADASELSPHDASVDAAPSIGDGAASTLQDAEAGLVDAPDAAPVTIAEGGAVDAGTTPIQARSSLILHTSWIGLGAADDPFTDRPAQVSCPAASVAAETLADEPVFSVDTGTCNYVTIKQPTLRAIAAGETIKIRLWHFELTAPEPAEAHAALLVDGLSVLDERIPIPQPGGLISRQLRVERAIAAGAPVYFHLHNHGLNSWSLVEVSAGP